MRILSLGKLATQQFNSFCVDRWLAPDGAAEVLRAICLEEAARS
jgi:hypothetical protein